MGRVIQTSKNLWHYILVMGLFCAPLVIYASAQADPTYKSSNYGVDEVFMGAGGLNDANSNSYQARASLGDITVGNTSGNIYQAYGGFTTTDQPYLEFAINGSSVDLGLMIKGNAYTTSGSFTVRTYLASGYSVVNASDPPVNEGDSSVHLTSLASPTAFSSGSEQFGINLVANTAPVAVGADPVQIPDASYSFGQVDSNYSTPNEYMYVKGGQVAFSNKSSGTTQFTISYMFSISDITPAGTYQFAHNLVATSTY